MYIKDDFKYYFYQTAVLADTNISTNQIIWNKISKANRIPLSKWTPNAKEKGT